MGNENKILRFMDSSPVGRPRSSRKILNAPTATSRSSSPSTGCWQLHPPRNATSRYVSYIMRRAAVPSRGFGLPVGTNPKKFSVEDPKHRSWTWCEKTRMTTRGTSRSRRSCNEFMEYIISTSYDLATFRTSR